MEQSPTTDRAVSLEEAVSLAIHDGGTARPLREFIDEVHTPLSDHQRTPSSTGFA